MANRTDTVATPPKTADAPKAGLPGWGWGALVAAEVVFFAWYWTVPLPNAAAAKTTLADGTTASESLRRWHLLAQALPHVIPDMSWNESLVGSAINRLCRFEFLAQRVPVAACGVWIVAAALGLGMLILRAIRLKSLALATKLAYSFGLGAAGLGVIALGFGRAGWLSPTTVRVGLGILAALGTALFVRDCWTSRVEARRGPTARQAIGFCLLAAPFLLLMVFGSMQPSIEFDSLEYHLQGPKEWFESGRIMFLPHNVYTSMPFNVEMLHLLGMHAMGDWWTGALVGQFVVMIHSMVAALAIGLAASMLGGIRVGLGAALIYLSTPWVYRLSVFGYVEGPLNLYHALALLAAIDAATARETARATSCWGLVGAFAGAAMACKYPALLTAVLPFGAWMLADAVRRRAAVGVAAFAIGVAIAIGPWLAKNLVDHGNPVYPLANSLFHGHPWSSAREAQWNRAHGPRPLHAAELVAGVSEVAGRNDWQSPLYLAFAPLAFLRKEWRKAAGWLAVYVLLIFACWWLFTHRLDRFWLPLLVPLAVLAGLGWNWASGGGWRAISRLMLLLGLASNWVFNTTALAGLNRWTDDLAVLRRDVPRIASPTLAWLNEHLPRGSRVLLVGQAGVFHLEVDHLYNTVFDDEILERLARDRSPQEFLEALHAQKITHILVDWAEIARHRKPGGYGFSAFVTPQRFKDWSLAGLLIPEPIPIAQKELYRVR